MSKPVIAIVGRPNVGKSTLFNKLIGERRAIVEDTPGVTRDRIYGETEWRGKVLTVIDTGGIEPKTDDVILAHMRMQAEIAIESADVIVFLCDVRTGPTADDREIAVMLKKSRKPVVVAVNKCDSVGSTPPEFYEFYEFGFDTELVALSSVHGTGTGDLLDEILAVLPDGEITEDPEEGIKVAVIGKPNAGKSSLVNRISGAERMIVSNIPGTTRDAIDTRVVNRYGTYTFIDTAGIRRSAKIKDSVEKYSVLRAHTAVERADVCLIMIDAGEGITEQDEKIAGIAHEAGKASVIVVNKWDSIEGKDNSTVRDFDNKIRIALSYMTYAPIMYVSALTGQRVSNLFGQINAVYSSVCHAHIHGNAQRRAARGGNARSAADGQGQAPAHLLHDPDLRRTADIRHLLQQRRAVPLLISEIYRKLPARHLRLCRNADKAHHPRKGRRRAVIPKGNPYVY